MKEMVGGCCVCSDERGWPENPLVYCDGQNCTVAVHQACYGIVTVPTGPWYCRKCESQERSARVRCELCPSRDGALKKTDNASWAHVVCALYIPEVRFGNVTTMEPIILQLIPAERYAKNCYICQEMGKGSRANVGACMQCNKTGCRMQFHVTCAQALGLLCEEAGNYLDNVKYCGYCQYHYSKLKKGGNVKTIPPYKPITHETGSSDSPSSPEKESEAPAAGGTPAQKPSQPNTATVTASALPTSASSSKQRKSSSASKGAALSNAATSSAIPTAPGSSAGAQQVAPALPGSSTTPPVTGTAGAGASSTGKTSSSSGSSKDKEKHSRSANKVSGSKDKGDSFRDKSSKSSSKGKDDFGASSLGVGHKSSAPGGNVGDKGGVLVSTPSTTTTKSSSIIAPSILQSSKELMSSSKETPGKFTTSNFTESVVVNSESVFGSDSSKGSTSSVSSTVAKKRKADTGKATSEDSNKDLIKDVSVTLIPLSSVDKLDLSDIKKVRTETATSSPSLQGTHDGNLGNPLMASSATTLAMSKQHMMGTQQPLVVQPATSIIKPPIMKDVGDLGRVQSSVSPFAAVSAPPETTTQSIRVSVPLSTASVAGISLPTSNNNSSSSSSSVGLMSPSTSTATSHGSLFQQALHNRSVEQVGAFGMAAARMGQQQQQQQQQMVGSRASPIVQVPSAHPNVILHQATLERQSPLVQTASASPHLPHTPVMEQSAPPAGSVTTAMQNLSPSMHGQLIASANVAAVHQSDSGMLKITYEKQAQPRVTPTPMQDEPQQLSGRRSSKSRSSKKRPTSASSSSSASACSKNLVKFDSTTECTFSLTNSNAAAAAGLNHGGDLMGGAGMTFGVEPQVAAKAPRAATRAQMSDTPPPHSTSRTPDTSTNFGTASAASATSFGGLKFTYESQPGTSAATTPAGASMVATSTAPAVLLPKDSPPSSPGSEAGGASTRKRSRKQATTTTSQQPPVQQQQQQESKEQLKIFQNGIHVTHMLGNQLNPASSVAQKMSDQLHMEIEAHSVYTAPAMDTSPQLVGPPFPGKQAPYTSSKATASQQGPPSLTTMLGAGSGSSSGSGTTPQSLEQLLERQWEQGSQFLMEQAQHFDIASLLSCLHQLQTENVRLEEHVNNLVARRDHLLAVNARLAIPLSNPNAVTGQVQFNSMNVNGPTEVAVSAAAGRTSRPSASGQPFGVQQPAGQQPPAQPPQATLQQIPVENGVDFRHSAVSAVTITSHQPPSSSNVRHSPVTQPFVAQAAVGGRQSASSSSDPSSRSRLGGPTAGASVFQAQQTTSSYQKLALLQQQQQAHTIRRDDGQVKPS
ncbi:protein AF-10 isoform X2 [Lutzomyia longipalpis]|uniref:protein AF-10 isoform X2 n=1 Tax=Lutzomyia longipalpis TaxID=7200 RepID=UPI002483CA62|nr:protein AF-10 isoform X2 [Lutzomyia longipalpis]